MTLISSIKFTQGAHTDVFGNAVFGTTVDGVVGFQNDPSSSATAWIWKMIDVPPGSTIPLGTITTAANGTFPQPDKTGGYLVELTASDGTNTVVSQLCFGVREASGRFVPPFKAVDPALTFGGNARGWAPYMEAWFQYIDSVSSGGGTISVDFVQTSNDSLTGLAARDGVTPVAGVTRGLFPEQTDPTANGIYVANAGAWTRSPDMNADADFVVGQTIHVSGGTVGRGLNFQLTAGASLAAAKTYSLLVPAGAINVTGAPWFMTGGADETTTLLAVFSHAADVVASTGRSVCVYFPAGKYYVSQTIPVPIGVSILGDGQLASSLNSYNIGAATVPLDLLRYSAALNVGGPQNGFVHNIAINHYVATGTIAQWTPSHTFAVGQKVRAKAPSSCLYQLVSQSGVTGLYQCTGELQPSNAVMKLVGTSLADADLLLKIIAGGQLGVMTFQVSTDGGSTYSATQTTTAGDVNTFLMSSLPSGLATWGATFGIKISNQQYVATNVYAPTPRVELLGTPPSEDYIVDVGIASSGKLGTMTFYEGHAQNTEKWFYGHTVTAGATQTPASGAYTDYVVPGLSGSPLTLRFHTGHYTHTPSENWNYLTPSQQWSMQAGTTVQDGGHVWQVVDGPACIRNDGRGSISIWNVTLQGGVFNYRHGQGEGAHIGGASNFQGSLAAAFWYSNNGDNRFGESGGFTNQNLIDGTCVIKSSGYGIAHDGGITFRVAGQIDIQSAPYGFIYWAGIEQTSMVGAYVETCYGKLRGTSLFGRDSVGHSGIDVSFTDTYLGTKQDRCLDVNGTVGLRTRNVTGGATSGSTIVGVASLVECDLQGTNQPRSVPFLDAVPNSGRVVTQNLEIKRMAEASPATLLSGFLAGAQNDNIAILNRENYFTSASGSGSVLISGFSWGGGTPYEGQNLVLWNFSGKGMTLQHQNANSTAAYRLYCANAQDITIPAPATGGFTKAVFKYFTVLGGWVVVDYTQSNALPINSQATTYTLVLSDADAVVSCTSATDVNFTIPHGVFGAGQKGAIKQDGAGRVSVIGDGTSVIVGTGTKRTSAQYATIYWFRDATTGQFTISGDQA